ncbi:TetR/AcrR family transcriptional regulator [Liquorilactobacillus nagelii]|jgi:AcrR family transcriptional regulator|uniref:TetR/AcrR family transcriptional regulator n=1 Tax=Liquorilactobacillus TaxID=2767888 RepID=UPI0006EFCFE5|nr:TetR/AcrR family transcriptional regulator [Liquorilactobacillus nagelii]KRL41116.1 transcriptional regulator [Liquorilactobacillus nagelii DSM 13675]QYH54045.1 TetR/AcrR family transcriptional regulator [Liquorilactobacillus nagelii DSM 13675]
MNGKQRIAEQSRQWFWEAFLELLQEKNYQKITIAEIAQRADLDRRTFYRSFRGKEGLIKWYFQKMLDQYHEVLYQQEQPLPLKIGLTLFLNFWLERHDTIQLLIQNKLTFHFLEIWTKEAIENYHLFTESWRTNGSETEITYIETFITGGLWEIINVWLAKDQPEDPQKIIKIFIKSLQQLSLTTSKLSDSDF